MNQHKQVSHFTNLLYDHVMKSPFFVSIFIAALMKELIQ